MDTTENKDSGTKGECCSTSVMHSSRVQGSLTLVLILLAAFLFAQTINALKEYRYIGSDVVPTSVITVSGEGEVFAKPDTAEFTFTLNEERATAGEAEEAVAAKASEVKNALLERDIEESDVKTLSYTLQPKYEWEPAVCAPYKPCNRTQVQKGFSVRQTVRVTVDDLNTTGEILALVTEKGVSEVGALSFTIDNEDALKEEARKVAITEATKKAEHLAADLGVMIVRVVGFNETEHYPMPIARTFAAEEAAGKGGGAVPTIPAGENQITANVMVTYEIK